VGVGPCVNYFFGSGFAGSYSELWSAVTGRHSSSLGSSTAADNDVPATCSRWPPYPNAKLFFAIVVTQIAAVFMRSQGWIVPPLPWRIIGFVWAYNVAWMIV
jgi:hypothetical protein